MIGLIGTNLNRKWFDKSHKNLNVKLSSESWLFLQSLATLQRLYWFNYITLSPAALWKPRFNPNIMGTFEGKNTLTRLCTQELRYFQTALEYPVPTVYSAGF